MTASSSLDERRTDVRASESWEAADVDMNLADREQVERTRRGFDAEEDIRPVKRMKSGRVEVYEESRERRMVTYPRLVDPVDDVDGPDTQLEDRHLSGLWDIVGENALKGATASQDHNSDDDSSNSDSFSEDEECTKSSQKSSQRTLSPQRRPSTPNILPSIEISPKGTESGNSPYLGTNDGGIEQHYHDPTANDIAGHCPRTPSPRHQPPISPAPYISPISPPTSIFQSLPFVPSSTFTPQAAHISPTSQWGSSTSPLRGLIPSAFPSTSYEEEGEEEE